MAYSIGVQRQMTSASNRVIPDGSPVLFDTNIPLTNTDTAISYSAGVFSFTKVGVYLVEWFVVVQTAPITSGPKFTLVATTGTTTPALVEYPSTSSFKTGTLSGSAIVEITYDDIDAVFTDLQLINDTGAQAALANNTDVLANITITRILPTIDGLEVNLATGADLAIGARVAFDTQISNFTSGQVTNAAGVFTVASDGIYVFDWSVSLGGADPLPTTGIRLDLRDVVTPATIVGTSVAPSFTQQYITGTAIVAAVAGQTFELVNSTGVLLTYDTASIKASMRVFTIA